MFTCESNAVNLTDGLDGLCAGTSIIAIAPFVIFALLQGNKDLAMLLLAVCGSLLGYLRFNVHPAKIFMGDTGSLAKKRVFRMAPLHHHFELGGMKETQVVLMFWSIGVVLAALGLWLGVM